LISMKVLCVSVLLFLNCFQLRGQCPDRTQLRNRILYLKSSSVDYRQQLNELLPVSALLEKCSQKNDSVRVLLLQRIGALHYLSGNFAEAVTWTLNAIDLLHSANNTYRDTSFLLRVYNFLQVYYDSLKLVENKMSAIDSCIHYALLTNAISDEILYNFWQLSTYTLDRGDFQRCIEYSSVGEMLTRKYASPADSIAYISSFFTNRINAHIEMGDYTIAETDLNKKISGFRSAGLENLCGPFYNQLSVIAIRNDRYDAALHYLLNSLDINKKYNQKLFVKETLNNIGFFYINHANDPASALKFFKEALQYKSSNPLDASKDEVETFNITGNIAYTYAQLNQFDLSDMNFQIAFDMLGKGIDENSLATMQLNQFNQNPKLIYITGLIRLKAAAFLKRFQLTGDAHYLDECIRVFRAGDRILTRGKATQKELQSQLFWRKDARRLYEQAINVCYIAGRPQEAFEFFERSRSVLLTDQISRNRSMSSSDINTRSQIETRLYQLRLLLNVAPVNSDEYSDTQKKILFLTRQKDRILASGSTPDTTALTYNVFRSKYDLNNQTILEIFNGDSAVFILAITSNDIVFKKVSKSKFNDLSSSFLEYVGDPIKCNSNFNDFVSVAARLHRLILDSIRIDGRLIVSPDENNFPFEALVSGTTNGDATYLINDHAVVYTYSAGFLLLDFSTPNDQASPLILGMAPVNFPKVYDLSSLLGSDESLKRIISRFGGSQYIAASAATKNEFLNNFYKYKIVQLYTHGEESGKAGVPVIYFSDSAFNLFDLIPVNKPATQLVVLSACETAKGKYYKGEGVFSFNRAFAEAGIPSSMVNLWSVDNQSSYKLTELFYKYLSRNLSFDEALRRAKIEFISTSGKERSLPFYWAATVLAGQTSSVPQRSNLSWVEIAGISLLVMSVVIVSIRYFIRSGSYN